MKKKEKILHAATELFSEAGVQQTTLEDIAKRCNARIIVNYLVSFAVKALSTHSASISSSYIRFGRDYKYLIKRAVEGR